MKNWKTKLFGDNSMNFYGWLFAGVLVCGASAYYVIRALRATEYLSTQESFLLAIYFMFLGQFGVAWHNYLARVAAKLDSAKNEREDDHAG